ncbi:Holliday junction branch migration protein RuvA [Lujinxingia litoralis]|uniref:Holliday junction branch migration complex subunit RuvA n=1 Tax=Lujinxingia litoralis TaxID=2211119 RepID=A0A328C9F4_9DELT|nr:Holliday junction branch migration protein RuvA [Lujinxingia litoralis]RAL23624.1 Holliday junction branch migration protein RuvA [Lujinxingia litoralis]
MIAHLTGHLLTSELDHVILDVRGVGYQVFMPVGHAGKLRPNEAAEVSLWVHTSVREDAIQLYGFASADDRRLFAKLISVSGIGPKIGLAVLSELEPAEVVLAVELDRIDTFTKVSGIGKKTAQRLILELKNALGDFSFERGATPAAAQHSTIDDLRSALQNLGYPPAMVDDTVDHVAREATGDEPVDVLLRMALKLLR